MPTRDLNKFLKVSLPPLISQYPAIWNHLKIVRGFRFCLEQMCTNLLVFSLCSLRTNANKAPLFLIFVGLQISVKWVE